MNITLNLCMLINFNLLFIEWLNSDLSLSFHVVLLCDRTRLAAQAAGIERRYRLLYC